MLGKNATRPGPYINLYITSTLPLGFPITFVVFMFITYKRCFGLPEEMLF